MITLENNFELPVKNKAEKNNLIKSVWFFNSLHQDSSVQNGHSLKLSYSSPFAPSRELTKCYQALFYIALWEVQHLSTVKEAELEEVSDWLEFEDRHNLFQNYHAAPQGSHVQPDN